MNRMKSLRDELNSIRAEIKDEASRGVDGLAERLKSIRSKAGVTQEHVADCAGLGRSQWTNIETGRSELSVKGLIIFCKLFNVSADEVLGLEKDND